MNKALIRKSYKLKRLELSSSDLKEISLKIIVHLTNEFNFSEKLVNLFLPIQKFNEIDLSPLIDKVLSRKGLICINKTDFKNHSLTPYLFSQQNQLEISDFGIPEPLCGTTVSPSKIHYVIVPMLAFDNNGNRVGYGKGFYDAFLSECNEEATFIGVNHFNDSIQINDIQKHDVALHYVITPEKIYKF
jgi:5-formyltetrahydrofolate cyclo-ligase